MSGIVNDFAYAARKLWSAPGFALTAVLTLALGIGSSAAIFTLLDQVTLRLLPVKNPERLVQLRWNGPWNGSNNGFAVWSYPWYEDLREQTGEVFSDLFGSYVLDAAVGAEGSAENYETALVTDNYFSSLGVGAALGRVLGLGDDDRAGPRSVAVLSHRYWRDRFGESPDVLGETILLNKHPFEIVGVAQPGFRGIDLAKAPGVFIPSRAKDLIATGFHRNVYLTRHRRGRWLQVFGRLRDGLSIEKAAAAFQPVMQAGIEYDLQQPELSGMGELGRTRYREAITELLPAARGVRNVSGSYDDPLWMLSAMVGLLLLIACGNVANLLMARASGRAKEVAIRFALGAGRWRVVRQLLAECALISAAAATLGLLISAWGADVILRFAPEGPLTANLATSPDARILAFAIGLAALTTFLFGLAPALRATGLRPAPTLKDQAGSVAGGNDLWRRGLAGAQIVFSLLLLIAAGLFQSSLAQLKDQDAGINTSQTLAFLVEPLQSGYSAEGTRDLVRRLEAELNARPEIAATGADLVRVLSGVNWSNTMRVEGYEPTPGESMSVYFHAVTPGYFSTLEIPILQGRAFTGADRADAPPVALVNQAFVERFFPDGNALGRHTNLTMGDAPRLEIVGVVPDLHYQDLREDIPVQVFVPFDQSPFDVGAHFYVRSGHDPAALAPVVRSVVAEMDPALPVADIRTMTAEVDSTLTAERLLAFLASAFGIAATLLAAVGLYGLLSYSVSRRRREIGLRMALGANRGNVARMVLSEVAWLFGAGAALAIPAALLLARTVESQLYGVAPHDPRAILTATAVLAAAAALAGALPALRAARTEPMAALRME